MPRRNITLTKGQIYHVFNRGVARMPIFSGPSDFKRFLELIDYYRHMNTPVSFSHFKKLAIEKRIEIFTTLKKEQNLHLEILAFCLMDNHYHFLIKQISENGIKIFFSNLQNGYAKYYNIKQNRSGPLFQPMFKSVRVETDEQLLHVSRYIHLNPSTGYKVAIKDLEKYPWSSLLYYIQENLVDTSCINTSYISNFFKYQNDYRKFVFDQADYQRYLSEIKHLLLE